MIKPDSLRAALTLAMPELHRSPERLLVFIDEGSIAASFAPGFSFEWRYTLNLIFTDFAGDPDAVIVPLLLWLRINQSELLANPDRFGEIKFEADVLANDKLDLSIKIPLTERVGVHPVAGGLTTLHYPEPPNDAAPELPAEPWRVLGRRNADG